MRKRGSKRWEVFIAVQPRVGHRDIVLGRGDHMVAAAEMAAGKIIEVVAGMASTTTKERP